MINSISDRHIFSISPLSFTVNGIRIRIDTMHAYINSDNNIEFTYGGESGARWKKYKNHVEALRHTCVYASNKKSNISRSIGNLHPSNCNTPYFLANSGWCEMEKSITLLNESMPEKYPGEDDYLYDRTFDETIDKVLFNAFKVVENFKIG